MTITSQFANMTSYLLSWRHHHVSRVNFSYWSKFHVNIITGSGVMTIFFYKGLTRNTEIPPPEFFPISGDWVKLGIPNFPRISPMKCYWILQNVRIIVFTIYHFWVIKGKPTGVKLPPPPCLPRLGLKCKQFPLSNSQCIIFLAKILYIVFEFTRSFLTKLNFSRLSKIFSCLRKIIFLISGIIFWSRLQSLGKLRQDGASCPVSFSEIKLWS